MNQLIISPTMRGWLESNVSLRSSAGLCSAASKVSHHALYILIKYKITLHLYWKTSKERSLHIYEHSLFHIPIHRVRGSFTRAVHALTNYAAPSRLGVGRRWEQSYMSEDAADDFTRLWRVRLWAEILNQETSRWRVIKQLRTTLRWTWATAEGRKYELISVLL